MSASDTAPEAIVAGHICLDLIPSFPEHAASTLAPGSLTRVGPAVRATGGAVSNTGMALHRLGVHTAMMGKVGDDLFGEEVLRLLRAQDPALAQGMIRAEGEDTSHSIVISPPGVDRSFLHCPGANDTFRPEDVDAERLAGARLLHFGYPPIMRLMCLDGGENLRAVLAKAGQRGLARSLDMCAIDPASEAGRVDWPALLAAVLPEVDLFLPSLDELAAMLGETPDEPPKRAQLHALAQRCLDMGAAVVGIKLGSHGLYMRAADEEARLARVGGELLSRPAAWRGRELWAPCLSAAYVSATGSGDCTIAGFLAGLLWGWSPSATARAATAAGAASVEAADAYSGVPSWAALQRRLEEGWPRHALPIAAAEGHVSADGIWETAPEGGGA